MSSVRPGASDRRECGTEGATSVFTALSTRLTLRLSALIILIHPSPLHPLRRTPALNTFPLLLLVIQFPHQQLLIHFRMPYINILLRRTVLSAFQKYLAQRIDYNSSFEFIIYNLWYKIHFESFKAEFFNTFCVIKSEQVVVSFYLLWSLNVTA